MWCGCMRGKKLVFGVGDVRKWQSLPVKCLEKRDGRMGGGGGFD